MSSCVAALLLALLGACSTAGVPAGATAGTILASEQATLADAFALDGAVVGGELYVFVPDSRGSLTSVDYHLAAADGAELQVRTTWEAPFEFPLGGVAWDMEALAAGRYLLVARGHFGDGEVQEARAEFEVAGPSSHPPAEPPAPPTGPAPSPPEPSAIWQPRPGTSWQWQLTGRIDTGVDAAVFDIDLFDTPASTIAELQRKGRRVICYFSAGSYEPWRADAASIPASVRGAKMDGWDELWLDVRRIDLLAPVMLARLDLAAEKNCDAVEPDNVDGYSNETGFPLSYADQLAYNRFLAAEAHARGLAIALKNDLEQVEDLVDHFDFAINEECFTWNECEMLLPFVRAGKAVFGTEYGHEAGAFCPHTNALNLDFIAKELNLGAWREACR